MKKGLSILLISAISVGAVGAILSIVMVIMAIQWLEWGRVLLYAVTTIVCVEMIVLAIGKLRSKENT